MRSALSRLGKHLEWHSGLSVRLAVIATARRNCRAHIHVCQSALAFPDRSLVSESEVGHSTGISDMGAEKSGRLVT